MTSPPVPRGAVQHPEAPADPADLRAFPRRTVTGEWHRAHVARSTTDRGCWHFSSVGADRAAGGRFDLPSPDGTCYLGSTAEVAARERVGPLLHRAAGVESVSEAVCSASLDGGLHAVIVTAVPVPHVRAANLPAPSAERWIDRSLSAGPGVYPIAQRWAAAFRAAGLDGLVYTPRFTLGPSPRSLALFGPAGTPDPPRPVGTSVLLRDVLEADGVRIVPLPRTSPAVLDPTAPPGRL